MEIESPPIHANVQLLAEPTLGLCFLIVATSSLWKVFSPQQTVDLVVSELWRQQNERIEQQRRIHHLSNLEGSQRSYSARQGDPQLKVQRMTCSSQQSARSGLRVACQQKLSKDTKGLQDGSGPVASRGRGGSKAEQALPTYNLQLAADLLERRFCEEWQLQKESEPLADLGIVILSLNGPSICGIEGENMSNCD